MFFVDTPTAVGAMPELSPAGTQGWFSSGNATIGRRGTRPGPDWFNIRQLEEKAFLDAVGMSPSKAVTSQMWQAALGMHRMVDISSTPNTVTLNPPVALSGYYDGIELRIKLANSITGPSVVNLSSLGTRPLVRPDGSPTRTGDGLAGQYIGVIFNAGSFVLFGSSTLGRLGAAGTFYVDGAAGTDALTSGLSSGASAFRTLQYAFDFAKGQVDLGGQDLALNIVGAVGSAVLAGPLRGQSGRRSLMINATGTTTITGTNAAGLAAYDGAMFYISEPGAASGNSPAANSVTITSTGTGAFTDAHGQGLTQGAGIYVAGGGSIVEIGNGVNFGANAVAALYAQGKGEIVLSGDFHVEGGGQAIMDAQNGGLIFFAGGNFFVGNSPTCSAAALYCVFGSTIQLPGVGYGTYGSGGAASTKKYIVNDTSLINTNGAGAGVLPGSISGTAQNAFNFQ